MLSTLNPERIGVAMISVGLAEKVFEECLAYAKQREAFGKPIGQFMIIQHYLADMAVGIENARNLVYKCAWLADTGKPFHVEATMAGLYASQMALDAATVGMEILGGYGVTMEADITALLARLAQAGELQRHIKRDQQELHRGVLRPPKSF